MNSIPLMKRFGASWLGPVRRGGVRDWPRWAPYAAVAWSLLYAALGVYWALSGRAFPSAPDMGPGEMGPLIGRFGPWAPWFAMFMAGIPAVGLGFAMLWGGRNGALRALLITAGTLLAAVLLLLMTGLDLLISLGYIPYTVFGLLTGSEGVQKIFMMLSESKWALAHQLLCLTGGFLWLVATVSYSRRSAGACLYCGRRNALEGWQSPARAARWGRVAVAVALVAPIFYALTRYAWALGIPLGMSAAYLRGGQERGTWVSGLFLANFGLVGAALMLGLIRRWGEVFPRWMAGLAGRRVPIALAVVPAALASVLLTVGGISIWSGLGQMVKNLSAAGEEGASLVGGIFFQVGPTLLFPVWGLALAVATLGYYYRRRGPCRACGRSASSVAG